MIIEENERGWGHGLGRTLSARCKSQRVPTFLSGSGCPKRGGDSEKLEVVIAIKNTPNVSCDSATLTFFFTCIRREEAELEKIVLHGRFELSTFRL